MKIKDELQGVITDHIITKEYTVAKTNQQNDVNDFEDYIDMFDAVRSAKKYDWMSDIFIPEFPIHLLTQSSMDVGQYFSTRDFVECYVMGDAPEDRSGAEATEECVNRTLNRRTLYHYLKYVRAKLTCHIAGLVYLECRWDADRNEFNYDVLDGRNVFTSKEYTYTLQDKEFVIFRDEVTYADLVADQEVNNYHLKDIKDKSLVKSETETRNETIRKDDPRANLSGTNLNKNFDRFKRYGKYWMKDGKIGVDAGGIPIEGAKLEEVIITVVRQGGHSFVIGFNKQPYKDWSGNPFRPITRGICYVHPTKDSGAGDGKYTKELQIGINDTFNANNDRTTLATFPTLKAKKYVMEDTDSMYIAPGHVMELEDPTSDVTELVISDNIQGGLAQGAMLKQKFDEVTAVYPNNVGQLPSVASTTATAVAGAANNANTRNNYKALTFENTALADMYWMIVQMTWQFASEETSILLMGNKVFDFNPRLDYHFKPLSQSVESEQAKGTKIQNLMQMLQIISQTQHPDAVAMFNQTVAHIGELMGKEYQAITDGLLGEDEPLGDGGGGGVAQGGEVASNQNGIPQSGDEQFARGQINGVVG